MARKVSTTTTTTRRYMKAAEVCGRIDVSPQTLSYWRSKGIGPVSFKIGGTLRYPEAEFEEWLAEQTAKTARGEMVKP